MEAWQQTVVVVYKGVPPAREAVAEQKSMLLL